MSDPDAAIYKEQIAIKDEVIAELERKITAFKEREKSYLLKIEEYEHTGLPMIEYFNLDADSHPLNI